MPFKAGRRLMKAGRNQQVVMRLIDAVSDNDKDRILSFFSDDSVYSDAKGTHIVGQEAMWNLIAGVEKNVEKVDWQLECMQETESGNVLTEGLVRHLIDGDWHEYPVKGSFEIRGSKITQWH